MTTPKLIRMDAQLKFDTQDVPGKRGVHVHAGDARAMTIEVPRGVGRVAATITAELGDVKVSVGRSCSVGDAHHKLFDLDGKASPQLLSVCPDAIDPKTGVLKEGKSVTIEVDTTFMHELSIDALPVAANAFVRVRGVGTK